VHLRRRVRARMGNTTNAASTVMTCAKLGRKQYLAGSMKGQGMMCKGQHGESSLDHGLWVVRPPPDVYPWGRQGTARGEQCAALWSMSRALEEVSAAAQML
jgi:hypothetical protein